MSVEIFGDTHGYLEANKLGYRHFHAGKKMTRDDYVIVCGDFGFPFLDDDFHPEAIHDPNSRIRSRRKSYLNWMRWLNRLPFTILFVDGNHDNHPYWYSLPVEEWHGGLVNRSPDADNVIHLKRGEVFSIDGHTFWTFGGACSHDKMFRTMGVDWWPEEVASYEEMQHGLDNLARYGNQVDFIITHTLPMKKLREFGFASVYADPMASYFNEVLNTATFKQWYCGHMHEDLQDEEMKVTVVYEKHHHIPCSDISST